jgi:1,4-dihydroxy-2-naphthoate octaprenyltransferase
LVYSNIFAVGAVTVVCRSNLISYYSGLKKVHLRITHSKPYVEILMKYGSLYFRMARPKQILLIALVYSWGSIMAINQGYPWSSGSYLMGLGAAILISISIHYANEYADYETDKLTIRTLYSGGSGALQDLGLERSLALKGALLALLLGVVLGTIGLFLGDIPVHGVVMLIIAVILGWGYSLKPLALAWRGWGEVDNAFLGAILLPVYGFTVISLQVERSICHCCLNSLWVARICQSTGNTLGRSSG